MKCDALDVLKQGCIVAIDTGLAKSALMNVDVACATVRGCNFRFTELQIDMARRAISDDMATGQREPRLHVVEERGVLSKGCPGIGLVARITRSAEFDFTVWIIRCDLTVRQTRKGEDDKGDDGANKSHLFFSMTFLAFPGERSKTREG